MEFHLPKIGVYYLVFGLHSNSRIEWFVDWDICSCYADVHAILGEENCS